MKVIGTAGHVDHGKSTLIAALTGTHPDRLKEEREREMTIDLGFGWLTTPGGEEIGIVDVPGHRDFIENMLAGVAGIDAALLVVAADEGVMPQTREHLAILDLLQIPFGLVVVTKVDLIQDKDWLDLVEADIRTALSGSALEHAPLVRVSARTGFGLDTLLSALSGILQETPTRSDLGRPRLPVDRVFSMSGFGTVVTGTLTDGHLDVGDEVVILPSGKTGRVRGLQTHKKKEDRALPGARTAVNISGLSVDDIHRGDVVATTGRYPTTRRVDAHLRLLGDASPLRHASEVKLFTGASETVGMTLLLEGDMLGPGEEAWVQLELRQPVVVAAGDRFILRRPSPSETLGGGTIVDALPKARHRRRDAAVLARLASLSHGSPADQFLQAAVALGAAPLREITARSRLGAAAAGPALVELVSSGSLLILENGSPAATADLLAVAATQWQALIAQTIRTVASYHQQYPLRHGMPREELKSRLKLSPRVFNAAIEQAAGQMLLIDGGQWIALASHQIKLTPSQQAKADGLLAKFAAGPYATPSVKECRAEVGEDVYSVLVEQGELLPISPEVVFRKKDYDEMVTDLRQYLLKHDKMTVAEARDLLNTSRKYVLALFEQLDATGITRREGDYRMLQH